MALGKKPQNLPVYGADLVQIRKKQAVITAIILLMCQLCQQKKLTFLLSYFLEGTFFPANVYLFIFSGLQLINLNATYLLLGCNWSGAELLCVQRSGHTSLLSCLSCQILTFCHVSFLSVQTPFVSGKDTQGFSLLVM